MTDAIVPIPDGEPTNRKLVAIQNIKGTAENSRTWLMEEWTTPSQSFPSPLDPQAETVTIDAGKTMEDLKTSLTNIWDSDASTDYQTQITSAIDSITTVLDSSIDDLTTAEDSQKEDPGIDAEPDTPEYDWKDESQW